MEEESLPGKRKSGKESGKKKLGPILSFKKSSSGKKGGDHLKRSKPTEDYGNDKNHGDEAEPKSTKKLRNNEGEDEVDNLNKYSKMVNNPDEKQEDDEVFSGPDQMQRISIEGNDDGLGFDDDMGMDMGEDELLPGDLDHREVMSDIGADRLDIEQLEDKLGGMEDLKESVVQAKLANNGRLTIDRKLDDIKEEDGTTNPFSGGTFNPNMGASGAMEEESLPKGKKQNDKKPKKNRKDRGGSKKRNDKNKKQPKKPKKDKDESKRNRKPNKK
jgi:hypothetical protein